MGAIMKISKQGLAIIKRFEGLELDAYMPTPNDVPTIGYGHTKTAKMGMTITARGADMLLKQDLAWVETSVNKHVKVALTQPQYDALCSFVYNLGATNFRRSTLLKRLNEGNFAAAADEFPRWNKQGKKVLRGLTHRRAAERELFISEPSVTTLTGPQGPTGGLLASLIALLMALFKNRS